MICGIEEFGPVDDGLLGDGLLKGDETSFDILGNGNDWDG